MSVRIETICQIIYENYSDPQFNVSCLANMMNLSFSSLSEIIYTHYRMSTQKLIETIRLEHALIFFGKNFENVNLVRIKSGYAHSKTFRNAFKNRLNMTPSVCKKIIHDSDNKDILIEKLVKKLYEN